MQNGKTGAPAPCPRDGGGLVQDSDSAAICSWRLAAIAPARPATTVGGLSSEGRVMSSDGGNISPYMPGCARAWRHKTSFCHGQGHCER